MLVVTVCEKQNTLLVSVPKSKCKKCGKLHHILLDETEKQTPVSDHRSENLNSKNEDRDQAYVVLLANLLLLSLKLAYSTPPRF